jgi:hypothetical protein
MEKLRECTPVAAGKTLIWLGWVSFLVSILLALLYAATLGVMALFG